MLRQNDVPEGTVITASEQQSGKGQRGRQWISSAGENLLCSVILKPVYLSLPNRFLLNKCAALAVFRLVREFLPETPAAIKWPNDILLNGNKVAGILLETTISGRHIGSCVVGIGLNVNQTDFPPQAGSPVSFRALVGKHFSIDEVLDSLCGHLEAMYLLLRAGNFDMIEQMFEEALWQKGIPRKFSLGGNIIVAQIIRSDIEGHLVLLGNDGTEYTLRHGEFEWLEG